MIHSSLLTELAEANLQILDGLQEGILDGNLNCPGEKEIPEVSFHFPEEDNENSIHSQYCEDS